MKGIPAGHAGLSSRAGHRHGVRSRAEEGQKGQAAKVEQEEARGRSGGRRSGAELSGALTAAFLFFAGRRCSASASSAPAACSNPEILIEGGEALRDRQYAPTLPPTARRSKRRSLRAGRARPRPTSRWPISTTMPAAIAGEQPRHRAAGRRGQGPARGLSRAPDPGPDSVAAARVSLAASKAGQFARFHDGSRRPATRARNHRLAGARRGHAQPAATPPIEAELAKQLTAGRPARRDRHAAVRGRRPGDEHRGRLA